MAPTGSLTLKGTYDLIGVGAGIGLIGAVAYRWVDHWLIGPGRQGWILPVLTILAIPAILIVGLFVSAFIFSWAAVKRSPSYASIRDRVWFGLVIRGLRLGVAVSHLAFLGDIMAVPEGWPLANVFSIGDVVLVIGAGRVLLGTRRLRSTEPANDLRPEVLLADQ